MAGGTGYSLHYRMGPTRLPALSVDALDRLTESICYLDEAGSWNRRGGNPNICATNGCRSHSD